MMISLNEVGLLLKQQSLFESLITARVHFRLQINKQHSYESRDIPIKTRFAKWKSYDLKKDISVPPASSKNYQVQFTFYKGSSLIGRTKSIITLGNNRKDCLDVIDDNYVSVGKCTYNIQWVSGSQRNQYNELSNIYANEMFQENQAPMHNGSQPPLSYSKQYAKPQNQNQTQTHNQIPKQYAKYAPQENTKISNNRSINLERERTQKKSGLFDSFIGCFGCTGRVRKPLNVQLTNIPIEYSEQELAYAPPSSIQAYPIQYYSRKFPTPQQRSF